jgi:hypothetical protein
METINLGGFPRSGNHFALEVFNTVAPDCRSVWIDHFMHHILELENVVTLIRNPDECIPAWIVLRKDERVNRAEKVLEWYVSYYETCRLASSFILPFESLISKPIECVNAALDRYNICIETKDSFDFDFSTGLHSPTESKLDFPKILDEMKIYSDYQRAMDIFHELNNISLI